ncbi:MAG: hypothetical protein ACXIT4_13305 [Erythrobacter sp.]
MLEGALPQGLEAAELAQFLRAVAADNDVADEIAAVLAGMLKPAKKAQAGWENSGIDILAQLAAMEGGLAGNLLLSEDTEALSVLDLSGETDPRLEGFFSYSLLAPRGENITYREYESLLPGVWFVVSGERIQRGNAICVKDIGLTLLTRRPYSAWDDDEILVIATGFALAEQLAGVDTCAVFNRGRNASYTMRNFLPDGRSLRALDAQKLRARVMRAEDLETFMRTAVPGFAPR